MEAKWARRIGVLATTAALTAASIGYAIISENGQLASSGTTPVETSGPQSNSSTIIPRGDYIPLALPGDNRIELIPLTGTPPEPVVQPDPSIPRIEQASTNRVLNAELIPLARPGDDKPELIPLAHPVEEIVFREV